MLPQLLSGAKSNRCLKCMAYPGEQLVFILNPTCCTEGCELHNLFPSEVQEYIPPTYSDPLLNTVFFPRDYPVNDEIQSLVMGIMCICKLFMLAGCMTLMRTGPKRYNFVTAPRS